MMNTDIQGQPLTSAHGIYYDGRGSIGSSKGGSNSSDDGAGGFSSTEHIYNQNNYFLGNQQPSIA